MYQLRRFQFFDREIVDLNTLKSPTGPLDWHGISCAASGRGFLIYGDADGFIRMIDKNMSVLQFRAFEGKVSQIQQLKTSNLLVCVGDETVPHPAQVLKVFKFEENAVERVEGPICVRTIVLGGLMNNRFEGTPVTTISVTEDLGRLAVGFDNGAVVILKGDILRDRHPKLSVLRSEQTDPTLIQPVTSVAWADAMSHSRQLCLYIVTPKSISSFVFSARDVHEEVLDDVTGSAPMCSVVTDDGELVKGVQEGAFFYQHDGRRGCIAFDGQKRLVRWFRSYLLMVVRDPSSSRNTDSLYVFDRGNRFIAFSGKFDEPIAFATCEWGLIFILLQGGRMFKLEEKIMQTKLQLLFSKNLYTIALSLAHSQHFDSSAIADIFKEYGDHLYNKQDYDRAMTQYQQTIGRLEPSYVIRKFLDAQRIHNLTEYLEELHVKGLATADHTTLLLNCYTKLKDESKLDHFIKDESLHFEVHTAIRVCRQAGYSEHALRLAKKYSEHDWVLKIQLEDMKAHAESLEYVSHLSRPIREHLLHKHGRSLLPKLPKQTTDVLLDLCRGNDATMPETLFHIFAGHPRALVTFLEGLVQLAESVRGKVPSSIWNTLLELYMRMESSSSDDGTTAVAALATTATNSDKPTDTPTPDTHIKTPSQVDRVLEILTHPDATYDADQALFLARLHHHNKAVLFLLEKLKLYREIVEHHMQNNDYPEIIRACKKYGEQDANLWMTVLSFFASRPDDCEAEIAEVLSAIERGNLLPSLQVIHVLSQSKTAKLGMIKEYIAGRLHAEQMLIENDMREIRRYGEETEKMKSDLHELRTQAKTFQQSKCSACHNLLDLPAVHFLCMHSYHSRCLGDAITCPECSESVRLVLKRKQDMERNARRHDDFFMRLGDAADGFNTVSEYFGRCVFAPSPTSPDSSSSPAPAPGGGGGGGRNAGAGVDSLPSSDRDALMSMSSSAASPSSVNSGRAGISAGGGSVGGGSALAGVRGEWGGKSSMGSSVR